MFIYFPSTDYVRNLFLLEGLTTGFTEYVEKKLNDHAKAALSKDPDADTSKYTPSSLSPFKVMQMQIHAIFYAKY